MARHRFDFRFLFDYDFYEENKNSQRFILKLMYISVNSEDHKKRHNVMSNKDFDKVLGNNLINRPYLRTAFWPLNEPESIEKIEDEITRNIKYAIWLGNERPFRTIIFTSKEKHEAYLKNPHLKDVKNVKIRSSEDAMRILDENHAKTMR